LGKKKTIIDSVISAAQEGKTLAEVLRESFSVSTRQLQKIVRTKGIFLDGKQSHSHTIVRCGQRLKVNLPAQEQVKVAPLAINLDILYEDNSILVVNKEPGISVFDSQNPQKPSLVNAVAEHYRRKGFTQSPRPVHRLDAATSGIVLFAQSSAVQNTLAKIWHSDAVKKQYWTLCEGELTATLTIEEPINDKPAKTVVSPLCYHSGYTEVDAVIFTGRTHQIRIHLRSVGHPVLGDRRYNRKSKFSLPRLALHHTRLTIVHPENQKQMVFTSAPPQINQIIPL